jgi:hypothetical protein
MKIDLEHLHHWMCAIRQSPDPIRTLDAFWSGQIKSKEWLIKELHQWCRQEVSVDIHGGWMGTLASMLFQSNLVISKIRTIDIDPSCSPIADEMNRLELIQGRFESITNNMCDVITNYDVVINTSCEHMSQPDFDKWLTNVSKQSLIVLQSNDYKIPEHIRIAKNLKEFEKQSSIDIAWSGELQLPLYRRFLIIGKKK